MLRSGMFASPLCDRLSGPSYTTCVDSKDRRRTRKQSEHHEIDSFRCEEGRSYESAARALCRRFVRPFRICALTCGEPEAYVFALWRILP